MEWIIALLLVLSGLYKYVLFLTIILIFLVFCGIPTGFFHNILAILGISIFGLIIFSILRGKTAK